MEGGNIWVYTYCRGWIAASRCTYPGFITPVTHHHPPYGTYQYLRVIPIYSYLAVSLGVIGINHIFIPPLRIRTILRVNTY